MKLQECVLRAALALGLGHSDYTVAACQHILRVFPYHIRARLLLGQALLELEQYPAAGQQFEAVLEVDPENTGAKSGLAAALERQGQLKRAIHELREATEISPGNPELRDAYLNLRAQLDRSEKGFSLSKSAQGKVLAKRGLHGQAIDLLNEALYYSPERRDMALARAECLWQMGRREEAAEACKAVVSGYPLTLKAKAMLARFFLEKGQTDAGVALLHDVRSLDPSDTVVGSLFREAGFQLPSIASAVQLPALNLPCPADVEAAIAAGATDMPPDEPPEDLPPVEVEVFAKAAREQSLHEFRRALQGASVGLLQSRPSSRSRLADDKGSYLLVTNAEALKRKYGPDGFRLIDRKLHGLRDVLREQGFGADLAYADSKESVAIFGLGPITSSVPDQVRSLVGGMDEWYAKRGSSLQQVLIVGGNDIMPQFQLANPAEDDDPSVYSDTPYAAASANVFRPQRSVGRLPDDNSTNPAFLLDLINNLIGQLNQPDPEERGWPLPVGLFRPLQKSQSAAFGYTALVWEESSRTVYEEIGDLGSLKTCPPVTDRSFDQRWLRNKRFLLFNLHGTEHSAYWYGQKNQEYPADFPLFPIAFSPQSLEGVDLTGAIVFSEACYGANIIDKGASDALAFQLLKRGAACVVGCTKIAYGSTEPPLTGADLLAQLFWQHLTLGATAGEALVMAKNDFVQRVNARQGYLDGDDQKTLIGFNLLGNPAAKLSGRWPKAKTIEKQLAELGTRDLAECPPLFCKLKSKMATQTQPRGDLIALARRSLVGAAPDTADCQLEVLARELCSDLMLQSCQECSSCAADAKGAGTGAFVVTTRKSIPLWDGTELRRVARVTLDPRGSVMKLSISK